MEIGDEVVDGGVALDRMTPLNEVLLGEKRNVEAKGGWGVGEMKGWV